MLTAAEVRWGRVEDAESLARVHVRGWQWGYRGLLPQAMLDELRPEARYERWHTWLSSGSPPARGVLVAHAQDKVFGFAALYPSDDVDSDPGLVGKIGSLYVDPPAWRRGIGRLLLDAARDSFCRAGFREATLWVLDTNEPSRRFYEACGWRWDGATQPDVVEGVDITEIRYRVNL